ncbi:MAG: hypothetical protein LBQ87_08670, partial [Candidatus Fibromonas sp.]|nr:hypothetical protein [Candidatus Fibromonas sp.]
MSRFFPVFGDFFMALPRLFAALNARLAGRPPDFAAHHFQAFVSFISVQVVSLPVQDNYFLYLLAEKAYFSKNGGSNMATATMEPQTMVEPGIIKTAMDRIGLRDKVEDLLDEIELQRRLKISAEQ